MLEDFDRSRSLAAFVEGELVGTLQGNLLSCTLPGPLSQDVLAITNATVLPSHRRRGVLTELLGGQLAEARRRGEAVAMLTASEGGIYRRFGFGPATWIARYVLQREMAQFLEPVEQGGGQVRMLSVEEAKQCFPPIFESCRKGRVGDIARVGSWWNELLEEEHRSPFVRFYACYEEQGSIDGYVIYEVQPRPASAGEREVQLIEHVGLTMAATARLWAFLAGIDLTTRLSTGERPVDDPLRHLLSNPRALRVSELNDATWVRLVDVKKALALRRYRGPASLVLEVEDAFCPWNNGRYALVVDGEGAPEVRASDAPAELMLQAADLAACYLGGTAFRALAQVGRVAEALPGAIERADELFSVHPAPFCATEF